MYAQAMDTMGKDRDDAPKAVRSAEEIERTLVGKARRVVDQRPRQE